MDLLQHGRLGIQTIKEEQSFLWGLNEGFQKFEGVGLMYINFFYGSKMRALKILGG